jgi:hypothetical protein
MVVVLKHHHQILVVLDWTPPILLVHNDGACRREGLQANMRVIPVRVSVDPRRESKYITDHSPIRPVEPILELELVVVEVAWGDRPPGHLRRSVAERAEELGETVPVHRGVLVREVIKYPHPVMTAFCEPQQRSWICTLMRELSPLASAGRSSVPFTTTDRRGWQSA